MNKQKLAEQLHAIIEEADQQISMCKAAAWLCANDAHSELEIAKAINSNIDSENDNAIVESLNKEAVSVYKAYWEYKRRVGEIVAEEGKYTKRRDKAQRILNKVTKESSDE